jgi:hypothetical protein
MEHPASDVSVILANRWKVLALRLKTIVIFKLAKKPLLGQKLFFEPEKAEFEMFMNHGG